MEKLNEDLFKLTANNLTLKEILKYSIVNKNLYQIFDENFYKRLAIKYYTKDFWEKAYKRPTFYSKPLKNTKMELIRIENFQLMLDRLNLKRWVQKDFYNYWKNNDKIIFNI